jgi:hypothetical protein
VVKQFMEATQEDGEQDRIRIMQDEDEILSLQAELDETLIEMEESSRRARYNAGRGEYNQQMVHRLSSELDTVKNACNLAVDEFSEGKTVGGQLLAQLNKVDAVDEAKTTENENLLKDFQDRNQEALDEMKKSKEGFEGERKLLLDHVEHFESLRDNLEKSLSEKIEVVSACKKKVSDTQELLDSRMRKL